MDLQTFLANLTVGDVGFAGLVSLAIYMIYTGRLVPRRHLDDTRTDRDSWKNAYQTNEKTLIELTHQVGQILEYAKTNDHLIRSINPGNSVAHHKGEEG